MKKQQSKFKNVLDYLTEDQKWSKPCTRKEGHQTVYRDADGTAYCPHCKAENIDSRRPDWCE
jgi:hypothetical protein